jgi:hypothetical protein
LLRLQVDDQCARTIIRLGVEFGENVNVPTVGLILAGRDFEAQQPRDEAIVAAEKADG